VVDEWGRVDVVVHNAAHLFFGLTEAFTPEQVLDAYDTNAVGARASTAPCSRPCAPMAPACCSGSAPTTRAISPFLGPYAAAKAAFDALAESTAWDLEGLGAHVSMTSWRED
jgi:NAD(P)-dependent dehydrogenase (short-subunit alcohol dehydrogenase family)